MMNDEVCLLNIDMKNSSSEEMRASSHVRRIFEKLIVNLLLCHDSTNPDFIKDSFYNLLLSDVVIYEIIPKIAIINKKDSTIQISKSYLSELDPYLFLKINAFQDNIFKELPKIEAYKNSDLVSGKFYEDLPIYLKNIQHQIYQSALPNFLSTLLTKLNQDTAPLIRHILKLILLNLQLTQESLKKNGTESKVLLQKIEESYFKEDFLKRLAGLLEEESFINCTLCIGKILVLLKEISTHLKQEFQDLIKSINFKAKEVKEDETITSESLVEEKKETDLDKELKCSHCLEIINEATDYYGIPIYVSFTNNFHDVTRKIPILKKKSFADSSWWPVVSSCNHRYHPECFEVVLKESQASYNKDFPNALSNNFEACCTQCKTLCNNFILLDNDNSNAEETDAEQESIIKKENKKFAHKIDVMLDTLIDKLTNHYFLHSHKDQINLLESTILKSYEYFIESFNGNNQPEDLRNNFSLYKNFLSSFRTSYIEKNQAINSSLSFFELVWESKKEQLLSLDNEKQVELLLNYLPEHQITQHLAKVLTHGFLNKAQNTQEEVLNKVQANILKEYLQLKMVMIVSRENVNGSISLKECIETLQNDNALKARIILMLVHHIKKIILASLLNKSILANTGIITQDISALLLKRKTTLEDLNALIIQAKISTSLDQLINEAIQELNLKFGPSLELLKIMLGPKASNVEIFPHNPPKMAPLMVNFPDNYLDYSSKYFKMKCSKCNVQSKYTKICLICKEMICIGSCIDDGIGSENLHALENHMGLGIYMDRVDFSIDITNSPLQIAGLKRNLYVDEIGQSILTFLEVPENSTLAVDFKKFTLNQPYVDELKKIIWYHKIGQYYFENRLILTKEEVEETCNNEGTY